MSNDCWGGGKGVKLSSWSIRTLSDCLRSIFTLKLRKEIASAITMFWQETSMKLGQSLLVDINMYKKRFIPGLIAWPSVFLAQGLWTVEITKRAN